MIKTQRSEMQFVDYQVLNTLGRPNARGEFILPELFLGYELLFWPNTWCLFKIPGDGLGINDHRATDAAVQIPKQTMVFTVTDVKRVVSAISDLAP